MEEALIAKLLATTAITTLVSNRIFVGARPQASTLPAIVVNRVSGAPLYSDDGEDGLEESRFQIDCWGSTYSSAKGLARAVRGALSAFQGTQSPVKFSLCVSRLRTRLTRIGDGRIRLSVSDFSRLHFYV